MDVFGLVCVTYRAGEVDSRTNFQRDITISSFVGAGPVEISVKLKAILKSRVRHIETTGSTIE